MREGTTDTPRCERTAARADGREAERWPPACVEPAAGYGGALAVEGRDWLLRCFDLTGRAVRRASTALLLLAGSAGCSGTFDPDAGCQGANGERVVLIEPSESWTAVTVGESAQLSASVRPITGGTVDVWGGGGCRFFYGPSESVSIDWSSTNPDVAAIDGSGLVTGRAEGSAEVVARATSRGIEARRAIWVLRR
jgi:hypothetical protein